MSSYLIDGNKFYCSGCGACEQVCPKSAITLEFDDEKFYYPKVNSDKCINCSMCEKVCPYTIQPEKYKEDKQAYGGHIRDKEILNESTSGGAFSAIVNANALENYVIFGATSEGLKVYHDFIDDKSQLGKLRKSKYSQSFIGNSYVKAKDFLKDGKYVIFSGTPCQISGLRKFLGNLNTDNLLTIEVICEGVPTPLFVEKYEEYIINKFKSPIKKLDYRFKDTNKWDFEVMMTLLDNDKELKKDRWFNPFWSIWLSHLMSRPSCYKCQHNTIERVADISLGDLWGVHIYCPDLYYKNRGASLVICNTEKGKKALKNALDHMEGRYIDFNSAFKYQSPLRKNIDMNKQRSMFMHDLEKMSYKKLCKKWAKKPDIKLLFSKYIFGNRQKVFLWNIKNRKEKNYD